MSWNAATACCGAARGREAAARSAKGTARRLGVRREGSIDFAAPNRRAARRDAKTASGAAAGATIAAAAGRASGSDDAMVVREARYEQNQAALCVHYFLVVGFDGLACAVTSQEALMGQTTPSEQSLFDGLSVS
jgi:hypothetical protein